MSWGSLAQFGAKGLAIWFALLALAVLWRQFRSGSALLDMLRSSADGGVDAERVQLTAVSGFVLLTYLVRALGVMQADGLPHSLPDLPNSLASIMTGSQAVYLAGKLTRGVSAQQRRDTP